AYPLVACQADLAAIGVHRRRWQKLTISRHRSGMSLAMARGGKSVGLGTADSPFFRHPFGTLPLMNQIITGTQVGIDLLVTASDVVDTRPPRLVPNTAGKNILRVSRGDSLSSEVNGLLAGAAHAIERDRRHLDRKAGQQYRQPSDVRSLLPGLRNGA